MFRSLLVWFGHRLGFFFCFKPLSSSSSSLSKKKYVESNKLYIRTLHDGFPLFNGTRSTHHHLLHDWIKWKCVLRLDSRRTHSFFPSVSSSFILIKIVSFRFDSFRFLHISQQHIKRNVYVSALAERNLSLKMLKIDIQTYRHT